MRTVSFAAATALALAGFTSLTVPAHAQGSTGPITRVGGTCPSGYTQGSTAQNSKPNPNMCYPGSGAPSVYVKNGACAAGYQSEFGYCTSKVSATYVPPTYGSITKANQLDRCPVGYWTDEGNLNICSTPYQGKAPASRLKRGAACSGEEVDEWGIYCTSRLHKLTRSEAENTAVADVNNLFALSGGKTSPQGAEYENTPGILALFPAGSAKSASPSSASAAASTPAAQTPCQPDASGAAIGGAIGGQAGVVIGGMLGGFGKKKKSGC
ncbi:hypothetical protein HGI47_15730 [Novosphingobium sp. ERN07]|uniref:hypothetical protein n=1 Tax=Novosphingobium sp. ERN07 TaxID=2726187 RepID=UPI001456DE05|nr:hypothetical protein [Novosphingobium sp. ERN07]NLR72325.1 hypothetical protein [Novosphingobium sp. ERN07]